MALPEPRLEHRDQAQELIDPLYPWIVDEWIIVKVKGNEHTSMWT
jgi:hypothetical protein